VIEYLPDIDTTGNECDYTHPATTDGAQEPGYFVDADNQHGLQTMRIPSFGWIGLSELD
jgi:hypothetical protein